MRARLVIGVLALVVPPLESAWGEVAQCTRGMLPIPDNRLQQSVDELKRKAPALTFQAEDPCGQARATTRALARTLRENYLKRLAGYEFVKVLHEHGYFTVERFRLRTLQDQRALVAALERCGPHCKLKIEENTCMRRFVAGENVVFMISSARGCAESAEKFRVIEESFTSSAELSPGP